MKRTLLFIILLISIKIFAQEGTKQLMPNSTDRLWLEFNTFASKDFGEYGASDKERIYIYLKDGETMHFGMKMYTDSNYGNDVITDPSYVRFRIQGPDTTEVFPEQDIPTSGDAGYIDTYSEAITGADGVILNGTTVTGGYTALTYTATKTGNHWIEFDATEDWFGMWLGWSNRFALEYFDVTVTDASNNVVTNPGDPNNSAGRLWSKGWGLTTASFTEYPVKTEFFVFTADEFVNKVKYEIKPYSFSFVANSYGVDTTSNLNYIEKAKSQEGDLTSTSDISEYRIFLNDPDRTVWVNTKLPPPMVKVWIEDNLIYDYDYSRNPQSITIPLDTIELEKNSVSCPYSDITMFKIETNVSGFTAVLLDTDGGGYSTNGNDRALYLDLKKGLNYVLWNFENDNGTVISDGNISSSATFLGRGPAHFPIYDAETLSGIETSSIRPFNKLGPTMYWDDRNISDWGDSGGAMDETDTSQLTIDNHISRVWTYDDRPSDNHNGNLNTLSSWFNAIDLGLPAINFNVSTSSTKCVNGDAPYVGNIYIQDEVDAVHTYSLVEFEEKYFDPNNDDLDSIVILSLPSNGVLKLSGANINPNDSIINTDIPNLTYTPDPGWSGIAKFAWKATNGTYWSLNQDTVYMIINTDPTISSIDDTTICTNTSLTDLPFTVGDAETDPGDLNIIAYSHDQTVVPNENILIGGSGANRTITINPPANTSGYTIIYVKVDDDLTEVIEEFALYIGPSISFIGDTTVCDGNPLELSAVEFGADSYSWIYDGSTIRTTQDLIIDPFTTDSVGEYTLTVSKDGCAASQIINVSIAPIVTFTGDALVCEGENISLSADETVAIYSWKKGLTEIATTKVLSITNADSGDDGSDYTLEVTKEGCNNTSDPFTISVIPQPTTSLTLLGSTVNRGNDGTVTIQSSENGVTYNAYISSTLVGSVIGDGNDVDIVISSADLSVGANTIDIRAENANCEIDMDNNSTITVIVEFTIDAISNVNVNENSAYTSVTPNLSGDTPVGTVTYTLGGNDAADFTINPSTGVVQMVARDYENPVDANANNVYELTITATDDNGNNDSEDWTVSIDDVVEVVNFTIDAISDATIDENSSYTSVIPNLSGDIPIGNITYTLGGTDASDFTINASTGVVQMIARDFESPEDNNADNVYELLIIATDDDGNFDSEDWTVTVQDVIELASFTINAISNVNNNENSAYTSVTPSISGSPIGNVTYTLGGNDAADFTINASTGVVQMVARDYENPVDANTDNMYELTITATDDDGNNDTEDWTVTIDDVVEVVNFTINPISDANVNENSVYTSVIPSLSGDTPIGNVTYTLGGIDAADFTINASTGVVQMVARDFENPVDANTDNVYELSITATDDDGNNDSESWTVTVDDVVEAVSFTIDAISDANVNENSAYTSVTPNLSGDTPIGNITYSVGGTDAADFTINASTGVVQMVAQNYESPVDANTDNAYELTITATDDDGNNDSESWTVTVDDVVEVANFTIDAISDANVNENSVYTSVTPSLSGDAPIGNVTYTIGGTDAADFTINPSTGVVQMVARDFENPVDANTDNDYEVTITATDDDGNSDSENWIVTVDDVVEVVSFTINAIGDANVNENSAYTSVTPTLSGDAPIGNITYTLGGGNAADFTINASTGVVQMVARDYESPIDANTDNVYELTITVTDDDGNTDSESWTVTVDDVIESVSFTIDAILDANVNENSAYTSVTPALSGDAPIGNVTYTLGGGDAADFTINASTGVVQMVARDYENPDDANTNNIYELSITVTDEDGNSDSESWTLTVDDIVEVANFTIDAISDANVNENSAYTSVTPALSGDIPIGSITYTLGGADASDFTINASTGVVQMVARDYESPDDADTNNDYEITITVTDDDGNSDSESWIVNVLDLSETAIFTIDAISNVNNNENSTYTSVTPSITGTYIGSITYSLGGSDAADFTINPSTGVVQMVARNYETPIDANTDNIYEISLIATDDDGNMDSEDWNVSIQDVIEVANFTIDAISDVNNNENNIYTGVTPNLSGDAPIGNVNYTLGGTDAALFTINATSGVVSMVARNFESAVDANSDNIYELSITATDEDGNSDSESWTVTIDDVVEVVSFTINAIGDVSINENTVYNSVTPVTSGDLPIGNLTYTLGGSDASDFTINASTGEVQMIARNFENPVDANTDNDYEITITATDEDGNADDESWVITILDVVETVSFTIDAVSDANVNENSAYTSVTPNLSGATPIGNVTYTISGTDAADFTINSSTGVVQMVARNYESPEDDNVDNVYELTITATDDDGNSDSESWTITVDDVVESANFTIDAISNANVNENSAYTSVTPNLSGATPIGNISYTLGGADALDFTINSSTGVVQMVARNYESPEDDNTDNVYELSITATDDDGNFDTESWTITINDIIETATFTIAEITDVSQNENGSYSSLIPSILGTPIGSLTFTLGGADASDFTINALTGEVQMIARNYESPEDANMDNTYEVSITATDEDGNSDSESWTVTIDDVIETVSFIIDAISNANVNENSAYTSVTPNLSGATPIGNVTYTISGTDASDFTINASTGVVQMVARNYESPEDDNVDNVYELTITATDDDGNSDSESWTVTVDDVVESANFTIDAISNANVNENSAYTSVTPNLSGDTPIGNVSYTLGGADALDFTINASTGVVQMVARNYESPEDDNTDNVYELSITATDDDGNFDTESWTITINDIIETATFTIAEITDVSQNENGSYSSLIPSILGTPIGSLTFTLGGADASDFTINALTGEVQMIARNYESPEDANMDNTYEVSITATDEDGNSDSESWTVTIDDVIETVSFTIDAISDANVNENSAYSSVTPNLSGATPIGNVTYTISGTDAADFTIDANTGDVSMVARDYESPEDDNIDNVYELIITATDDDGNSDSESWTVTVDDVVESANFTIDAISNANVNENGAYVTTVPGITGTPIGNITYTLGGIDAASFTINTSTGVVQMVARNFENPEDVNADNIYEVSIIATDDDGNFDSESWTVTIGDVIETVSFTIDAISDATINENSAYSSVIPSLSGDIPIGDITYTLGGIDASQFTIDPSTGLVEMIARNYESPEDNDLNNIYELYITATDDDGNFDTEDWTVTVNDVVETVTFTIDPIANVTINENNSYASVIPNISGTPVGTIEYTLGGADASSFTINSITGEVSMIARDYEDPQDANLDNTYELVIIATDDDSNTDIEDWTVTIQNVIEPADFTIDAVNDTSIVEGFAYIGPTLNLSGDTPTGDITYTLGGIDANDFTINASTGVVQMVARDFENPEDDDRDNDYELTVIATDEEGNTDSESWTVTIKVDTDNDGIPDDIDTDDDNDGNPDLTDPNRLIAVAMDDILTVIEGETDSVNVLDNDDFIPGVSTSIVDLGTGTAAGTVVLNGVTGEMSYTPVVSEVGSDVTVIYRVANIAVSPVVYAEATVTISVVSANNIPVAVNDTGLTDEDTNYNIDVLDNDTGLEDGGITVSVVTDPVNGLVVVETDNTITYSPSVDFYGQDSIEYEVCDVDGECSTAKVYITVNPVSDFTPVANDDSRGTSINTATDIDVLFNDTGLGDGGLVLSVTNNPSNGTYTINSDNTITYTPVADYTGEDEFDYQICDIDGDCSIATVKIIVKINNRTPVAIDDNASTIINNSVVVDVLNNDTGLEDGVGSVSEYSAPTNGSISINADNTITYIPNADYIGLDSFEYIVKDIDGDYAIANVSITVNETPDYIPVANDDSKGTSINTAVVVDVLDNDTGLEDGGLTLTVTNDPSNGTYTINGDNTITYTPNTDYLGTDNFEYQVCDADGDCSTATVSIVVKLNNRTPIAVDDNASTIMNTSVNIDVLNNDTGLEDGVQDVTEYSSPSHGSIVVNVDNTVTYTPNNWYVGSDSFEYKVKDVDGDYAIARVSVTITTVPNYIPVANDDSRGTLMNTAVVVDVLNNDTGLEDGGLVLSITNNPSNGTYVINGDNTITYTPNADYLGTDNFEYQVCDTDGDCSSANVTILVKNANNIPVAVDDNINTIMNTPVNIDVLNNDTGLEDGFGAITISSKSLLGSISINLDNTITYTPPNWFVGTESFDYILTDIDGDYDIATVTITINPRPNYIPVAVDDARGTNVNTPINIDVLFNDSGLEDGGIVITVVSNPTNGTFSILGDNTITYTPSDSYIGMDNFDYEVCDFDGDCSQATVSITVRENNTVPVAENDKVFTNVNTDVTIDVLGNDTGLDDGGISVDIYELATNGSVSVNGDNTINYSPDVGFEGTDKFSYYVADIDGDYDIADVEVIVMSGTLPAITISEISTNTEEDGTQSTFTVALTTQPTNDVHIDLYSDDITEGIVSDSRLTFSTIDWNLPKTVTITGQDDHVDDDDISYNIIFNNAVSDDSYYSGLTINNLSLSNIDDDVAGISITPDGAQTSENGDTVQLKIVLNSEPLQDVSLEFTSDNMLEGMIDVIDVLFTSSNWSDTVNIHVIGQDDNEVDGDISYNIIISTSTSADPKYDGIDLVDIALINIDNDSRELTIPEAFSPGNDGFNDFFEIVNLEYHDQASIKVYNRWGSLVYSNSNYQNDWDGKSNVGSSIGSDLPTGTYFFVLEISDMRKQINGSVFIKR